MSHRNETDDKYTEKEEIWLKNAKYKGGKFAAKKKMGSVADRCLEAIRMLSDWRTLPVLSAITRRTLRYADL